MTEGTPARLIGRYELIHELGRGGMATVFLARDPAFERQVAVKVLPPQFLHDPQFRARFQREAKVIAALEHPYIVPVYDYGEEAGQPFLVMRYMPGGTLAQRMNGRPMPRAQVAEIVHRLAEALDEAHTQGIIHRDLKPANVMFDTRNQAFLSDFGIAKMLAGTTSLTGSGVVGTPAYMSPEQAVGDKAIDGRSDVYSLGVMVYEMLTGHQPYEADTPIRLLLKHVTEPVPQINLAEASRLDLPREFNEILAHALAKNAQERYATAAELAAPLTQLSLPVAALGVAPAPPRSRPSPAGRPWWLALAGIVGVAGLIGLGVWLGLNLDGGGSNNLTPTVVNSPSSLPALAPATAMATLTLSPVASLTAKPEPTLSPSAPPSVSPVDQQTVQPSTATPNLSAIPLLSATPTRRATTQARVTASPTPTPECPPDETFDPVMNICRPPDTEMPPTDVPPDPGIIDTPIPGPSDTPDVPPEPTATP